MEQKPSMMKQKPSMRERLAAARQRRKESQAIQAARQELQEAVEGLLYSKDFFQALNDGDGLGIGELRARGYPQPTAVGNWLLKSWEDWLGEMRFLASSGGKIGEGAQEILALMEPFNENEVTREVLSGYFSKVVRPSQRIYRPEQFDIFLGHLTAEGLAAKHLQRPAFGRTLEWKGEWYGPSSSLKISRALWPFIERAKRRVERYAELSQTVLPRLEWLEGQASFENDLTSQNFQRILTHPDTMSGMMVIWEAHSRTRGEWDEETRRRPLEDAGLLAVLIGYPRIGSPPAIEGWEADQPLPFPKDQRVELPSFNLNLTITDEIASITFLKEAFKRLKKEEREGWWRIQWLMNRWLSREGRYRVPALVEAQETSAPEPSPRREEKPQE